MKIVQIVPRRDAYERLKTSLKRKERELRGAGTTLLREREARWRHVKYPGWIQWDDIWADHCRRDSKQNEGGEWQPLQSFVGYLDRHFSEYIESVTIIYR